jgi:hypothetical protein
MAMKEVGKVEWENGDLGDGGFVRLEEGSNVVRILTQPSQTYNHWTEDESGQNRKIRCSLENCPICQRGEPSKARWLVGVLSRKTEKPAILEIGPQIFKQIRGLKQKKSWGDPRTYDIDIERMPKNSQPLYCCTPEAKAKLSKDELIMVKEFIETTDFDALTAPATPEQVKEELGLSDDFSDDTNASTTESFDSTGDDTGTDDDDDFSFE